MANPIPLLRLLSFFVKCFAMIAGFLLLLAGALFLLGTVVPKAEVPNKIHLVMAGISLMICGSLPFIRNGWIVRYRLRVALYFCITVLPWLALPIVSAVVCRSSIAFSLSCNETMGELVIFMAVVFLAHASLVFDILVKRAEQM